MHVEWKIVIGNPQVIRKLKEFSEIKFSNLQSKLQGKKIHTHRQETLHVRKRTE